MFSSQDFLPMTYTYITEHLITNLTLEEADLNDMPVFENHKVVEQVKRSPETETPLRKCLCCAKISHILIYYMNLYR